MAALRRDRLTEANRLNAGPTSAERGPREHDRLVDEHHCQTVIANFEERAFQKRFGDMDLGCDSVLLNEPRRAGSTAKIAFSWLRAFGSRG
jgi:hypothetical protein